MSKDKSKKKSKKAASKRRDDGAKEIQRAERRLAKAIESSNEARKNVARRERDLAQTLARYGRSVPVAAASDMAIPLDAPAVSENGVGQEDHETSDEFVDVDAVEQH